MKTNFLNLAAKMPQNTGGGSSQHCVQRSIGAQRFTLQSIGAQYFTRFLGSSCRVWKYVACMLMVLCLGIGNVWGVNDTITLTGLTAHNSDKAVSEYFAASSTLSVGTNEELTSLTSGVDITSGYVWNTNGSNNTTLNSVSYACGQIYQNKSGKKWSEANPVFYAQFVIPTGATFTLSKINYAFGTKSAAFTTVIEIYNQTTSSAVYTSSTIDISSGGTAVSNITGLTNVLNSGTYRIKVSPATTSTSTGKYWGMGKLEVIGEYTAASSTNYTISYNANGGSGTMENTTNMVAACGFTAPTGKAFAGWKDADDNDYEVGATVTADVELIAQWADAYAVTYTVGAGSGTAPAAAQYAEGVKFNLPGQGSMVAPAGKVFDGWKAGGTKYAENAEYTMGDDAVEFVAQWKALPQTIFHWRSNSGTRTIDAANGTTIGGTVTLRTTDSEKSWAEEGATYVSGVAGDMKGTVSGKELKSGGNALYLELALTTGTFQEGDTIFVTGYLPWIFSSTTTFAPFDVADSIFTGSGNGSVNTGYAIVKEGIDASKIYARRGRGKSSGIAAIKVIRPAERPVASTAISLSDLKVNNISLSSDSLAALVSAKSLQLKDEYAVAPVIKFNEHTVITYADSELPATKEKDKVYTVTATVNGEGKWQAQQTINEVTYTVKAAKVSAAKVTYYDGSTKIGEEVVAINGSPVNAGDYDDKTLSSFVGWYNNADLAEEHKIANIAALVVTKDTTVYGKWNPEYATSINIEQWVLTNGAGKTATTKTSALISQLGTNNFASNLAWENGNLELDSLDDDPSKDARNNAYLGLKVKKSGKMLDFRLAASKTVKVKFGEIKSTLPQVAINGGEYAAMSITDKVYTYTAAADAYISIKTADANTIVFKQIMIGDDPEFETVVLPYRVTYDADGGIFANDGKSDIYTGTPLSIGDATPADAENYLFDGWYDGDTKINAAAYVPTKNVTLVAKYVLKPSPFSLTALTYTIGAGAAQNVGYVEGTYTYSIELPYANSYENITVAATLKEAGSSIVDDATKVLTVTSLPGAATFTVSDGAEGTQLYTINFKKGAKDGVEIIGVVTTGGTNKTISGLYQGDASVDLDADKKLGSGKKIYVTLASGYTFEETDVLVVDVHQKADLDGGTKALEITTGVGDISGSVWKSIALEDYTTGENIIPLTGINANQTSIGLKRSTNQNTWVNGLKVYRPMMPELTAITINGEAAVKGEGNTFAVTLPEDGTNLASLTIVPTIIRNAAHATTPEAVVSNEGAWKEGANTYRVMDKDGDYTDYTITLTLQGEAAAPVIGTQPATQAYCAGSEPTLTVVATGDELHYAWFKEAGETDEAVGTDATSYTVASAGTYYVVVTNHVDGKLDVSVTSENAVITLNVAAAITTQPTNKSEIVSGSSVTLSLVATNATSYQWYSCDDAEKTNAAAISGAEAADYMFTCTANGYYYCEVGNACGDAILSNVVSVKLEPEGCNTFASEPAAAPYNYEQTGEWTFYNVDSNGADKSTDNVFTDGKNFNDDDVVVANTRRFALKFEKAVESVILYGVGGNDKSFTKLSISDEMTKNTYTELTVTATKTDVADKQHVFTIEDMIIPAGKYAWFEFSGSLNFFKICYTEGLAKPVVPTLSNQELCSGEDFAEIDATSSKTGEGTLSYQWFNATDEENPVAISGATNARYTPTAEGKYYVEVTNAAVGHVSNKAKSNTITMAHFAAAEITTYPEDQRKDAGQNATLTVVASGKDPLTYQWYTCDDELGTNPVLIAGAEEYTYEVTITAGMSQYYKVVVGSGCGEASAVALVEEWHELPQVAVSTTTTWDWVNAGENIKLTGETTPKKDEECVMANVKVGGKMPTNDETFNSQALMFYGENVRAKDGSRYYASLGHISFKVTVPGKVTVEFSTNTDDKIRCVKVNGVASETSDKKVTVKTFSTIVPAGEVSIVGYEGEEEDAYIRISKIIFDTNPDVSDADYTRDVTEGRLGTICLPNGGIMVGASLYEIAYMNYKEDKTTPNKIYFDEIPGGVMVAGMPYIFFPNEGATQLGVYYTDAANAPAGKHNGLYGTLTDMNSSDESGADLIGNYIFNNNMFYTVTPNNVRLAANRAYVKACSELPGYGNPNYRAAPAKPGRRRMAAGVNAPQIATGLEDAAANEKPVKVLINGEMFIIRGEKMYDATGRLVK